MGAETKLSVWPVAAVVVPVAKDAGARVIVNAQPTDTDAPADIVMRGSIGDLLAQLVG